MCNCGGRRSALAAQARSAAPERARSYSDDLLVPLASVGIQVVVLRGSVSGREYRFPPRAVLRVDPRDAAGLLASGRVRRAG